ncbi:MAG: alcohol dehydrogenase [Chloroflexi bacterium RBG_16_56_11]|nr:MAG: alcohol dehydrogenase [Chloroflexi bacterium RBG_16_56_11]
MVSPRTFRMPVSIFGHGSSDNAGAELKALGAKKVFIVTDEVLWKMGTLTKIAASLNAEKLEFQVFDKLPTEPTVEFVEEGIRLLKESGCNIILAVGGGTPIDTAKAISVMARNPGKIQDYIGANKIPGPGLPLVAIPATAGTGSEVTIFTIITNTKTSVKMLISSPYLMPTLAIVDPLLTVSMPLGLTAATGLDALTHAIEAYVSRKAQPMTDILSLSAMRLLSANLPLAWADGKNLEAREKTMLGSYQAGLAFGNASVALVHGMSRPIGACFHVAHGMSNAVLLGPVMEFSLSGNPGRYAEIAAAIGENVAGLDDMAAAEAGARAVRRLIKYLEIPRLRDLGIEKTRFFELMPEMIDAAIASGSPDNNPRIATREEMAGIYRQAY